MDSGLKIISMFCRGLQEAKMASTMYIKQKWDKETNKCISEQDWLRYCEFQWKISNSTSWRTFDWKSLCRYFITPVQTSHQSRFSSCWRKCGSKKANHFHLFWACPVITIFWQKICTQLRVIYGSKTFLNWNELLFGILHLTLTNTKTKYLFGKLSVAARKAITKKWHKPGSTSIEDWYDIIYDFFIMERITFSIKVTQNEIWRKSRIMENIHFSKAHLLYLILIYLFFINSFYFCFILYFFHI